MATMIGQSRDSTQFDGPTASVNFYRLRSVRSSPSSISHFSLHLPFPPTSSPSALRLIRRVPSSALFSLLLNLSHNACFSHLSRGMFLFPSGKKSFQEVTRRKTVPTNFDRNSSPALLSLAPLPPESLALLSADGTPRRVARRR